MERGLYVTNNVNIFVNKGKGTEIQCEHTDNVSQWFGMWLHFGKNRCFSKLQKQNSATNWHLMRNYTLDSEKHTQEYKNPTMILNKFTMLRRMSLTFSWETTMQRWGKKTQ